MNDEPDDIDSLKLEIFELKATLLISQIRLRAFQMLSTIIWEHQEVKLHPSDQIPTVLRRFEKEQANLLLADYADKNPTMAAILKSYADDAFGDISSNG